MAKIEILDVLGKISIFTIPNITIFTTFAVSMSFLKDTPPPSMFAVFGVTGLSH